MSGPLCVLVIKPVLDGEIRGSLAPNRVRDYDEEYCERGARLEESDQVGGSVRGGAL